MTVLAAGFAPATAAPMPGCVSWLVFVVILIGIALTSYIHYSIMLGASIQLGDNTWMAGLLLFLFLGLSWLAVTAGVAGLEKYIDAEKLKKAMQVSK